MMRTKVTVHVPATSANLGPGFDCLGIALDLWNVIEFSVRGERLKCVVEGQGEGSLPAGRANVIFQGVERLYALANRPMPAGMEVHCRNDIPVGSGMGSSAAAALAGLMGANALLDDWVDEATLLNLCAEMEGHGDNAAAAFYGGCRLVAEDEGKWITQPIRVEPMQVVIVIPAIHISTHEMRKALPAAAPYRDVVFNISRTALLIEALQTDNRLLMRRVMQDRLHQPYRLPLIKGAEAAIEAASEADPLAAVAMSGAGPAIIAFGASEPEAVQTAMESAFLQQGVGIRAKYILTAGGKGAWAED